MNTSGAVKPLKRRLETLERVYLMAAQIQGEQRVPMHSHGAAPQGMPSHDRQAAAVSPDDLALRAKNGDKSALEELIKSFEAAVYRICYRILNNPVLAEDARQE